MADDTSLTHAELGELLAQAQLGVGASDLHGSLAGYLCGGGRSGARDFLEALQLESDDAHALDRAHEALGRLYTGCLGALDDPELGFEPLLPDESRPLDERADALVEWCRGFLGGFGLSSGDRPAQLSEEATELLRDLATIAGSSLSFEDAEEDERALVEVLEFVRVGAMMLHAEVAGARSRRVDAPGSDSLH